MTCIIIEDEPLAMERAQNYVQKLPFLQLLSTFDNAIDAMPFLKNNTVDLIFLDINLGAFSGIQLLESTTIKSQVILTTAYHEYALKGYDLKITDYLLKPYSFERFVQAVDRAQSLTHTLAQTPVHKPEPAKEKTFIFVKTEYRLEKIFLDEILYIEGKGSYRRIHTPTKRLMTLQTFIEFEQEIPASILCRVHKSFMVAIAKIEAIERDRISIQNAMIPISETYKQAFFEIIQPFSK
jgi:two-component system, LytTR family, response regulator